MTHPSVFWAVSTENQLSLCREKWDQESETHTLFHCQPYETRERHASFVGIGTFKMLGLLRFITNSQSFCLTHIVRSS